MRTEFSLSVTAAIEAARQAAEVELGSSVQFVSFTVETFNERKVSWDAYPKRQERQVSITADFVRIDPFGTEVDKSEGSFFVDLHLERKAPEKRWTVKANTPCHMTIGKNQYTASWGGFRNGASEVRVSANYLEGRKDTWNIGTNWQNRRQEPVLAKA